MESLGTYFTWPLFIARLLTILVMLPLLLIISMFMTGMMYVDDKLEGRQTGFLETLVEVFKTIFMNTFLFLIGGRKIIKR